LQAKKKVKKKVCVSYFSLLESKKKNVAHLAVLVGHLGRVRSPCSGW